MKQVAGGLRRDILEIVRHGNGRELWVFVGTNGVKVKGNLARVLREAGNDEEVL